MKSFPMIKARKPNRLEKQNKQGDKIRKHDYKYRHAEQDTKWYKPPAPPEPKQEPVEQTTE